ncbi:hypothetical protein PU629_10255 [Pullulanibacillus sp. KACC 23026]|uniref:hypothetical protein n=1 Tax=Pullulanibacillus sp. KACC 23026 TaxID=3028315 RepID=UPI0023AF0581|nr:hypothetical protein [Pullulanibacillus sp. KACC 23026]WEG14697.1 hypothetical protein PU629_10255 [Pullulanibacillus sp. KACC 23026]
MNKIEEMDLLINNSNKISSSEVCEIVHQLFGFDLDTTPVLHNENERNAREAIDFYLAEFKEEEVDGLKIKNMINELFGINLEALSRLDGKRISLYSKDHWVIQNDHDLFVVHTGDGDIDAKIYPTALFKQKTGSETIPEELATQLEKLGYTYNPEIKGYYYLDPNSEAVSDEFKGKTMMSIMKVIQNSYSNL